MIVTSSNLSSNIQIPTSKSYANRALILAALSAQEVTIRSLPKAQDVSDLLGVLSELDIIKMIDDSTVKITKSFPVDEKIQEQPKELYLGEGGTTIRFLLPFLSLGKQEYIIKVHPNFKSRPYEDLLTTLVELGVSVEKLDGENELCTIQGPIRFKPITVDCSKTTQVLSSLLLIQSFNDFKIDAINLNSSISYVDMTKKIISDLERENEYRVPVDLSCAGYFLALGSVFSELYINNLYKEDVFQADNKIFDVLDLMGVVYSFSDYGIHIVQSDNLGSFEIDISKCLDLAPTLAFLASFGNDVSILKNISNLKHKESNRIVSIRDVLSKFGIKNELIDDNLYIYPSQAQCNDELTVVADHRIVMMAALFMKTTGGGIVHPSQAVNKSFPEFFELLS